LKAVRLLVEPWVRYPYLARWKGQYGRVLVGFILRTDGSIRDVRVLSGSGSALLDEAALQAVMDAAPFPPPPRTVRVITPVAFRLK
jgi:periplasmic protein TonB